MRGLTMRPPAAYAVAHLGKPIENRSRGPGGIVGEVIAVHSAAGERLALDAIMRAYVMRASGQALPDELPRGVVVATARVSGFITADDPRAASAWFTGPVGWLLDDVLTLRDPVPCSGGQGLWVVPDGVAARLHNG